MRLRSDQLPRILFATLGDHRGEPFLEGVAPIARDLAGDGGQLRTARFRFCFDLKKDDRRIGHPLVEMIGDALRQAFIRVGEMVVGNEDDFARLHHLTPQPIAAALKHAGKPMPQEAGLIVERLADVGRKISLLGTKQWGGVAGLIDAGDIPAERCRFDQNR